MIDLNAATFGCELELADVDTKIEIPPLLGQWDHKDGSVCNSNGTANDPRKVLNRYGGEVQVTPAESPETLVNRVYEIYELLQPLAFNFTTNLHVHIHVPGLRDNLPALKKIIKWLDSNGELMFHLIDPIPLPMRSDLKEDEFQGAMKRYKRRKRSHHYVLSHNVYKKLMASRTPEEFFLAHVPTDDEGKPQWQLYLRPGVNLAHLWKTDTIEFRCFTMTAEKAKLMSAFCFPIIFLDAVLQSNRNPKEMLKYHPSFKFQEFWPYNYEQDKIFQMTNVYHQPRAKARRNYELLIKRGAIKEEDLR